jgi:hypothetical protein
LPSPLPFKSDPALPSFFLTLSHHLFRRERKREREREKEREMLGCQTDRTAERERDSRESYPRSSRSL